MRLAVRVQSGEVLIELTGVAGRQQRVLNLLAELRDGLPAMGAHPACPPASLALRTGGNAMTIRVSSHGAEPIRAEAIYGWLRRALVADSAARDEAAALTA
ncbi:MAG TPA: hypothetical protein VMU33_17135 [Burkholderiaceae bacterium]|nr:hypothetical protein [Burkholderiaceae bacterium]